MRLLISLFLLLGIFAMGAAAFDKSVENPVILQKGEGAAWCPVCGMSLKMFYKTSHAATEADGQTRHYCSIRCLAAEHAHNLPSTIKAVDAGSAKLIDARTATYLIGSDIPGTMSMTGKLAFAAKADAEAFQKEHGGHLGRFNDALTQARSDKEKDDAMRMKKKEKMVYPKGKMLYEKLCKKPIDAHAFASLPALKAHIQTHALCSGVDEPKLQALSLYLWDHREGAADSHDHSRGKGMQIDVPAQAKCPVCGMFVAKYPRWAAKMTMPNGTDHYFDGAKDMFKFYLQQHAGPEGAGLVLVTDYYTQQAFPAKGAYYVQGSDVYGPMGHELIPFKTLQDAKTFARDHKGEKILRFLEVDMALLKKLDE